MLLKFYRKFKKKPIISILARTLQFAESTFYRSTIFHSLYLINLWQLHRHFCNVHQGKKPVRYFDAYHKFGFERFAPLFYLVMDYTGLFFSSKLAMGVVNVVRSKISPHI
jgi:hypothetical protein